MQTCAYIGRRRRTQTADGGVAPCSRALNPTPFSQHPRLRNMPTHMTARLHKVITSTPGSRRRTRGPWKRGSSKCGRPTHGPWTSVGVPGRRGAVSPLLGTLNQMHRWLPQPAGRRGHPFLHTAAPCPRLLTLYASGTAGNAVRDASPPAVLPQSSQKEAEQSSHGPPKKKQNAPC